MKFILENECEHKERIVKEMTLESLEKLYKLAAARYHNFGGLTIDFDFIKDNDYDGMVTIKKNGV